MTAADVTAPLPPKEDSGDSALGAGRVFGRYLIVDRVGAGGVGEVYAAYDPNLDRRIALKVLRGTGVGAEASTAGSGSGAGSGSASGGAPGWGRLVREAQALAKLSHPNVVAVHDVGVSEGRTFIAMELVDGVDLSAWLDHEPKPHWRTRLRTLIDAGHGLKAAHDKQTIHRDFKPANVLVGKDGRVRVSDFGLARLLDRPNSAEDLDDRTDEIRLDLDATAATLTRKGVLVGTPYYMAPEQYDGAEASVRTDIYAYCLTLHEALYNDRPFPMTSVAALAAAKEAGVPAAPATASEIPRRIRHAIARGLSPDPSDRWPSMAALLSALERNPARTYRRLAPLGVAGATALAAAVVLTDGDEACSAAARHLDGVWDANRRTELDDAFDRSGLSFAAESAPSVHAALDAYAERWVTAHTSACDATRLGEQSTERLDRSMACLDRRLTGLDTLLEVIGRGEAAAVERALSAVHALPSVDACLDPSQDIAAPTDPDLAAAVEAQRTRLAEVAALTRAGLHAEALPLAESVAVEAEALEHPPLSAEAKLRLGRALRDMGKFDPAEKTLEEAVWLAHGAGHARVQAQAAVGLVLLVGAKRARPEDGLRWARYAQSQIDKEGGDLVLRSTLAGHTALAHYKAGDYDSAKPEFERALALLAEAGLEESPQAAATIDNMGIVERYRGLYKESIATHRRSLEMRKAAFGTGHPLVAKSMNNLAASLTEDAQYDEAERMYAEVIALRVNAYGENHPDVASALNNLASQHIRRAEYGEAEVLLRRVLKIRRTVMPGHPKVAASLSNLALSLAEQNRLAEAAGLYTEAVQLQGDSAEPRTRANTLSNYGNLLVQQGDIGGAIAKYERAVELFEEQLGPDHPEVALVLANLANMHEEQGRFAQARAMQERALAIREAALGPDHPDVAVSLAGLSGSYQAAGEPGPAVPLLERALLIAQDKRLGDDFLAAIEFELAQALDSTGGDKARARKLAQAARARFVQMPGREHDLANVDDFLRE